MCRHVMKVVILFSVTWYRASLSNGSVVSVRLPGGMCLKSLLITTESDRLGILSTYFTYSDG